MFANRLKAEDLTYADETLYKREVENPSWEMIKDAITRLDGDKRSTVVVGPSNLHEGFMVIGGGESGVYVCFVIDKDGTEINLLNPSEESDENMSVFMGETSIRSKKEAVDLETVLRVAKTYSASGKLDESLHWRRN